MFSDDELCVTFNNYGYQAKKNGHFFAAKQAFLQSLKLKKTSVALGNLGSIYHDLNDYETAKDYMYEALNLNPNDAMTWTNLGLIYATKRKYEDSINCFNKALGIDPNWIAAKWNRSISLLDSGEWTQGFKEYSSRFEYEKENYPTYPAPLWNGEDLSYKSIIVYGEQGFGDRILFSRYIFALKQKYPKCHISLMTEHALHPLLWEFVAYGICSYLPMGVPIPKSDYGVYIMSLPGLMGTTPNDVPPDPGLIKQRILPFKDSYELKTLTPKGIKVGICWAGNPAQVLNHQRSIPFAKILDLIDDPFITWYSLQVGPKSKDIVEFGAEKLLIDLAPEIMKEGFTKTGTFMMNLDLVISIDTSVVHLAGALGIPTYTILAYAPYWIWTGNETKTAWYPNMRLFRQKTPGSWDDPLIQIALALAEIVKKTKFINKQ